MTRHGFGWMRVCSGVAAAAVMVVAGAAIARAAEPSDAAFYKKTGLKIVVASGAGGGYDVYTRVLARHYAAHLPGNPNTVVQNMPGASGITGTNWAYNNAPRDGSVIVATYSALIDSTLLGEKNARFDVQKFGWIGSIASSQLVCVTWHDSPYTDIRQLIGKPATVSATGRTGKAATLPLILNQVLGTKFKVIMGYSTSGSRLALERKEVDALCGMGLPTLQASAPEWLANKKVHIIAQVGLTKLPELQDVPNVLDLVTGSDHDVFEYGAIMDQMGRPYLAPPELPPERLAVLRAGFDETMTDPAFVAEIKKLKLTVDPMTGQEMEKWINKLYSFPPETIQRVSQILGIATKEKVESCDKYSKSREHCK